MALNKNKPKVFLTGGNGMVGKNILSHPLSSKWDFFAPGRKELDLTNFDLLVEYIDNLKPDFIIHTAGHIGGINASVNNPVDFFLKNLDIGRNVIVAAHQAKVKRLINLGSSCMYPKNAPNPLSEEKILKGELEDTNEGYALAKISIQRLCEYIHTEDNKFQYKTIIPCNLYGCFDKFDTYRAHLIPAIINKLHHIIVSPRTHWWSSIEPEYASIECITVLRALRRPALQCPKICPCLSRCLSRWWHTAVYGIY